ncbi:YycC family protein [Paenibacillus abyssi]|uniref:YycC family protein n=1 Tax=Paenibacillus abyssi TaxID=1340531 RepID=A0A917D056_9BACL|nr:YycC family protein [Paenibacillus abyssi]GGG04932.1 YycC family protein [Paenibacillus abyssi]
MSKPLQISPETAIKLAEQLKVPIEHLMHMPRHILLQKLAELTAGEAKKADESKDSPS